MSQLEAALRMDAEELAGDLYKNACAERDALKIALRGNNEESTYWAMKYKEANEAINAIKADRESLREHLAKSSEREQRVLNQVDVEAERAGNALNSVDTLLDVLQDFYDHGYDRGKCEAAITSKGTS